MLAFCQLSSARKYIVSYRIVSYRRKVPNGVQGERTYLLYFVHCDILTKPCQSWDTRYLIRFSLDFQESHSAGPLPPLRHPLTHPPAEQLRVSTVCELVFCRGHHVRPRSESATSGDPHRLPGGVHRQRSTWAERLLEAQRTASFQS